MAVVRKHSSSKTKKDRRPRADDVIRKRKPSPGPGGHGERTWASSFGGGSIAQTETRQQAKDRLYGVTLLHGVTPGNIKKGNVFMEGPGKGKGKIASSTVHSGGKHSMRHKYQAQIENDVRSAYTARNKSGTKSRDKSAWGTHDVSTNNPYGY